jgi:hypothetical protein
MSYRNASTKIFLVALLFFPLAYRIGAQEQPQQPPPQEPQFPPATEPQQPPQEPPDENNPYGSMPKPAGKSLPYFDFGLGNGDIHPDYTPLTGMLNAGLGFPDVKHSYWVPGISYSSTVQSHLFGSPTTTGWYENNYVTGNISLLEAWTHSQFALNYSGGATFSTNNELGTSGFQQLAFAQSFLLNRWIIQIVDEFSQLPQSGFGFGVGTALGIPGIGGSLGPTIPGIGSNYSPSQSIFGGFGPRYSNTAVMQATYALTRRSSITASAAYGILNFVDPGNIDTRSLFASLGYNYAVTHNDSIGAYYQYGSYQFPGNPQAYHTQTVSAAYSRKITGRLALSLYGGPQFTSLRIPVGSTSTLVNAYASAFLTYALQNGSISGHYLHGISGGSGVLEGSIEDQLGVSAGRKLTRVWHASFNVGYAHNRTVVSSAGIANPSYDDWFAGVGIGRPIGRSLSFNLAYTATFQTSNPGCSGTGCASGTTSGQVVTVNFAWHPRPFVLQ